jgi:TolB protein
MQTMKWWIVLASLALAAWAWGAAQQNPLSPEEGLPESHWLLNVRQLTYDLGDSTSPSRSFLRAGEAYFSPDQTEVVFQAIRGENPFYQIYRLRLGDSVPQLVSTGRGRCTCAYYHPRGDKILFASSHLDPNVEETEAAEREKLAQEAKNPSAQRRRYEWAFDPYMDIFEADLATRSLRRLTDAPGYDAEGSYSPDGSRIVFCSTRDGNPELYVMNSDGSHPLRLTQARGYDGGPFFSPDGKRIVFRSDRDREGYLQIYVINADGTGEEKLTNLPGVAWAPYWHPQGRYVVFSYAPYDIPGQRPNFDLYLLDVETRQMRRITYHPGPDVLPVFSPDGTKLLWTSRGRGRAKESQIFLAEFDLEGFLKRAPVEPATP